VIAVVAVEPSLSESPCVYVIVSFDAVVVPIVRIVAPVME
jgi:hypothetical protein